jgi:hypothetical protein
MKFRIGTRSNISVVLSAAGKQCLALILLALLQSIDHSLIHRILASPSLLLRTDRTILSLFLDLGDN